MSTSNIIYRRGTHEDMRAAHRVFRISLYDLLHRMGYLDSPDVSDEKITQNFEERFLLYDYLSNHAEQYWLAERDETIIGLARTTLEDGVRELTEFFVSPTIQSVGVGRELLSRALLDDDNINCIIATGDVRAQARYLKAGVYPRHTIYELEREPRERDIPTQLTAQKVDLSDDILDLLSEIDKTVIGFKHPAQHRWLLSDRSLYIYRVDGEIIGYGYVGKQAGPFALHAPQYFPAVIAHAETLSAELGNERIMFVVPSVNTVAISDLLSNGYQIDPFIMHFMSTKPIGRFDHYLGTDPAIVL